MRPGTSRAPAGVVATSAWVWTRWSEGGFALAPYAAYTVEFPEEEDKTEEEMEALLEKFEDELRDLLLDFNTRTGLTAHFWEA